MTLSALGLALLLTPAATLDEPEPAAGRRPVTSDVPERATEAPAPKPVPAGADDDGLDGLVVAALQLAGSCATYLVAFPMLAFTAYLCPVAGCAMCLVPAAAGCAGTWIGDRFGTTRAPAIWPILAAYAGLVVSAIGVGVIYFAILTGTSPLLAMAGSVGVIVGIGASLIGVPVGYALAAEEKRPGDDGGALPGLFEANHPGAAPSRRSPTAPRRSTPPDAPRPPKAPLPDLPPPPLLEPLGQLQVMRF
ncbi:MAG: hypothetical protein A2138_26695 [Deltaproteobacteria bacterium RBG_16_71_12]|nr:MAG: hypothetical protein A2138_26695 [Deltaproteobacteria bacterium RBG_16_71_12]